MGKGFFDVLQDDNSSDESSSSSNSDQSESLRSSSHRNLVVPSFEDLSLCRTDEETVLEAVYGSDYAKITREGRTPRLTVHVRPPDTDQDHVGTQLVLCLRLSKHYPYVTPTLQLKKVVGLSKGEQEELLEQLYQRANQLAQIGSVMMVELVQVAEDYVLAHNRDPTMSAWEQMKAREAMEQEMERRQQEQQEEEINRLLKRSSSPIGSSKLSLTEHSDHSGKLRVNEAGSDIKRELNRQMEALEDARRRKQQSNDNIGEGTALAEAVANEVRHIGGEEMDDYSEDDQSDPDDDLAALTTWGGSSRYQADFIELGVLGRGGGGEVVKVRNRLDRRIYAIKKIILESERGKFAKAGAIQNRKLRREVTTISRMTHKNIVRYYQAWVEGDVDTIDEATLEKEFDTELDTTKSADFQIVGDDEDIEDSSDDSSSGQGIWVKPPPKGKFLSDSGEGSDGNGSSSSSDDASYASNEGKNNGKRGYMDMSSDFKSSDTRNRSLHSQSMENLLELEHDHNGLQRSPLLAGLGFQSRPYEILPQTNNKKRSNSIDSDEDFWDESSVKVGTGGGQRILYIQMEYCSSTLRKLIDDGTTVKMDDAELWRLVRQIIEALVYIHSRNIIHRDLKPGPSGALLPILVG